MKISREQFFCDPHVEEFVDWLSAKTECIAVNLDIKKSNYVNDAMVLSKSCRCFVWILVASKCDFAE